jgi:protein SCO1
MRRSQRALLLPLVVTGMASVLLVLTCAGHPVGVPGEPSNREGASPRMPTRATALAAAPRGDYFPNIVLRTQDNEPRRFYDDLLRGKVVLINFFYLTCGDICPLMTANLVRVQAALGERLGREVFMYSITLDPQTDTPEVLKQYAAGYGVKPGWSFLTGQDAEIQRLRRTLGLYERDARIDADKTQHTGLLIYGNEATGRWGAVPALLAPERIVRAVLRVMWPPPALLTPRRP